MAEKSPLEFWPYTLALYGKPGLPPALIGLQDRLGLDVNLLIYCCWAAARGVRLEAEDIAAADRAVAAWRHQVIEPLRALRQRAKAGIDGIAASASEPYRKKMIELEVAGEQIAQETMAQHLPQRVAVDKPRPTAAAHLALYLAERCRTAAPADRAALALLLDAAFPT